MYSITNIKKSEHPGISIEFISVRNSDSYCYVSNKSCPFVYCEYIYYIIWQDFFDIWYISIMHYRYSSRVTTRYILYWILCHTQQEIYILNQFITKQYLENHGLICPLFGIKYKDMWVRWLCIFSLLHQIKNMYVQDIYLLLNYCTA